MEGSAGFAVLDANEDQQGLQQMQSNPIRTNQSIMYNR
jgi:hypothetical protein